MIMYFDKEKLEHINPWMLTYFKHTSIFSDWNKVINYLDNVNNGEFDTSYWTL